MKEKEWSHLGLSAHIAQTTGEADKMRSLKRAKKESLDEVVAGYLLAAVCGVGIACALVFWS